MRETLAWNDDKRLFYFMPNPESITKRFSYHASKQKTTAEVVSVYKKSPSDPAISYVRHHAFSPRFEKIGSAWYLVVSPTYFFTFDGYRRHTYPDALLSGKKRLDNNNSVRGQVIMWHRLLSGADPDSTGELLAAREKPKKAIEIGSPPTIQLPKSVPEDVWRDKHRHAVATRDEKQGSLF